MAAELSPAFQLYPKDLLSDTTFMQMSLAAKGAYIVLSMHCWLNKTLPAGSKNKTVAALLGCSQKTLSRLWVELEPCFEVRPDGTLIDPRIERIREKQAQFRETQRTKARASAEVRWGSGSIPVTGPVSVLPKPEGNSPSPISDLLSPDKNRVAGSFVQSVQRTATEKKRKEPAAARQIPDLENNNGNPKEHAAILAYEALTAETHAELEREAAERLKTPLDYTGQPEERAAMIRRSVVRELENPTVRERCGLVTHQDAHEHQGNNGIKPRAQNAAAKR